jgi:hypothetical protein
MSAAATTKGKGGMARKTYTKADPSRASKLRVYRSRIRWQVWTAILQHELTHEQLGDKLGDKNLWQLRKWSQGFRRTVPIHLAIRAAREFKLPLRPMLEPEQIGLVEEIQSAEKI